MFSRFASKSCKILAFAAACGVSAEGRAQDSDRPRRVGRSEVEAQNGANRTDEIVVVGSRTEELASDSPVRVDVIPRSQIETSGARDAAELLEEFPGVLVTRSFRGDAIQLGGLDPEYTLILVDGERVPGRIGGGIDLGRYGVENIERIEILRGPGSALYGSDAIAGVVNIVTRPPTEGLTAEGSVTYGYGMGSVLDATALTSGTFGQWSARINGGLHLADGFDRDPSTPATDGSARAQASLGGIFEYRIRPRQKFDLRLDYINRSLSGVDMNDAGAVFDRTQSGEQFQMSVGENLRMQDGTQLRFRLAYSMFREGYVYDQRNSSALDDVQDNREHLGQATLQVDHTFGDHRVSVGVEGLQQNLQSQRLTSFGDRARYSPFAQDDWTIFENRDFILVAVVGARLDIDTQFGTQLSPRAGLRFDAVKDVLIFRATYGFGFRAPSFQELLLRFENPSVGYIVTGNPNLGPESSRGLDAGVEWIPSSDIKLRCFFFRNDLDGMIATVTDDSSMFGTLFTYKNISSAYTQGVDAAMTWTGLTGLRLQLSYSFLNTFDNELQRPLENRPEHRGTLNATYLHTESGFLATVRTAAMGYRVTFNDDNGDGVEERVLQVPVIQSDARVGLRFLDHFEAFVGVDNIFDVGDAHLFARPRTFYVGLKSRVQ